MTWLELPQTIPLGVDDVTVRRIADLDSLGFWDEVTGTIALREGQPPPGELLVLIHEALHVAETALQQAGIIDEKIPEEFIENVAPVMALILSGLGLIKDVTPADIHDFLSMIYVEGPEQ
jgi:hypothetical protein